MTSTYVFEGVMTALTSISHIGDTFGINARLRREKVAQPDGTVEEVPIVSGNSLRGILRDRGMLHMLRCLGYGVDDENGEVDGLSLAAFYFLFSGGALTKDSGRGLDIDEARKWREMIPLVALFGGAMGNQIMPGKAKIGKAIPICKEVAHILPSRMIPVDYDVALRELVDIIPVPAGQVANAVAQYIGDQRRITYLSDWIDIATEVMHLFDFTEEDIALDFSNTLASIWEMVQEESYTRRDDEKNENLRKLIAAPVRALLEAKATDERAKAGTNDDHVGETGQKQQMRYHVETIAAGTRLFWEVTLDDVTDLEYEAFAMTLAEFSRSPYIGGKSGVGHGKVSIEFDNWIEINPRITPTGKEIDTPLGTRYMEHLKSRGDEIRELIDGLS